MLKKTLGILLLSTMIFSTFSVMPALAKKDGKKHAAGSVIKVKGKSNVYYIGDDGKRYVFPNSKTYFSWFNDFSNVEEVEFEDLSNYELEGNVTYKPGALLVKIQSDPKVYAVGVNGILRWIKTEKIAKALYGKNWNKLVDDVPVQFFGNYKRGNPIEVEDDFEPTEEEGQAPTISHNKGFKALIKIVKRTRIQKTCGRLEGSLKRLQNRFERWGVDISDESDEVLDKCYGIRDNIMDQLVNKKVTICHKGETLSVGAPAIKGHLRHGDSLGACEGDDSGDNGDDQDVVDETAPVISDVAADATEVEATVTWTTDEGADSKVYYSTTTGAISSSLFEENTATTTTHSIGLIGLTASTTYYYVVESTDESGNTATSTEAMFTTSEEVVVDETAPVIDNVVATPSATSTVVIWDTDEDSSSRVYYAIESLATATSTFDVFDSVMTMIHSLSLMDLATSTEYFYYVESEDGSGNTATSTEVTFTTLAE